MDIISHTSTLNPNAPLFIPQYYRTVEDFSDEWWSLVDTSPWFRDFWLQECFEDPQIDPLVFDISEDLDSFYTEFVGKDYSPVNEEMKNGDRKDLALLGSLKWEKARTRLSQGPRHVEKAPKVVNVKVSPRPIQQPR